MNQTNEPKGSPLPVVCVILAVGVLGLAGWDAMLQNRVKGLEKQVSELQDRIDGKPAGKSTRGKAAAAAPVIPPPATAPATQATGRKGGRGLRGATTQPVTQPATPPNAPAVTPAATPEAPK